ncbi:MAG: hypothetical protein KatS3mg042_1039 [Rhodothermaceae bacterium]|nr:MAG: hypothetical protein KatS3mg042_1039 [Rhodothermaceae bacterium]
MAADFWLSLGLGAGIGLLYGGVSYLTCRRALPAPKRRFLTLVWGGTVARLFAALALITLILVLVPLRVPVFLGVFFAFYVLTLVAEVYVLHRARHTASSDA